MSIPFLYGKYQFSLDFWWTDLANKIQKWFPLKAMKEDGSYYVISANKAS